MSSRRVIKNRFVFCLNWNSLKRFLINNCVNIFLHKIKANCCDYYRLIYYLLGSFSHVFIRAALKTLFLWKCFMCLQVVFRFIPSHHLSFLISFLRFDVIPYVKPLCLQMAHCRNCGVHLLLYKNLCVVLVSSVPSQHWSKKKPIVKTSYKTI